MSVIDVKSNVQAMVKPYAPKDITIYDSWTRMDRNESLFGIAPKVKEAVLKELEFASRYPENTALQLREALAKHFAIDKDCFLIGNGSYELIWLVASVFLDGNSECVVTEPSFIWYNIYGKLLGEKVNIVKYKNFHLDLEEVLDQITDRTKLVFLCNPNNPIGNYISTEALSSFMKRIPEKVLVVIDEAYIEFMEDYNPKKSIKLLENFENVLLLRTFSKFYGLASFRIGYAIGSKELVNALFQFRIPPNHSRYAEVAAKASIEDTAFQQQVRSMAKEERAFIYQGLEKLNVKYMPTNTNFMLMQFNEKTELVVDALKTEKILVKSGKEFGLEGWIRLSIGNRAANERFINIVGEVLRKSTPGEDILK